MGIGAVLLEMFVGDEGSSGATNNMKRIQSGEMQRKHGRENA